MYLSSASSFWWRGFWWRWWGPGWCIRWSGGRSRWRASDCWSWSSPAGCWEASLWYCCPAPRRAFRRSIYRPAGIHSASRGYRTASYRSRSSTSCYPRSWRHTAYSIIPGWSTLCGVYSSGSILGLVSLRCALFNPSVCRSSNRSYPSCGDITLIIKITTVPVILAMSVVTMITGIAVIVIKIAAVTV